MTRFKTPANRLRMIPRMESAYDAVSGRASYLYEEVSDFIDEFEVLPLALDNTGFVPLEWRIRYDKIMHKIGDA